MPKERQAASVVDQLIGELNTARGREEWERRWRASLAGQLTHAAGDTDPDHARWAREWTKGPGGKIEHHSTAIDGKQLKLVYERTFNPDPSGESTEGRTLFVFRDQDYWYLAIGRRSLEDSTRFELTRTLVLNATELQVLGEILNSLKS